MQIALTGSIMVIGGIIGAAIFIPQLIDDWVSKSSSQLRTDATMSFASLVALVFGIIMLIPYIGI